MNTTRPPSLFSNHLRERTMDLLDWVDFRPDACLWPLLLVPVMLVAFGLIVDFSLATAMLVAALLLTLVVAVLIGVVAAAWVVANALVDVTLDAIRNVEMRQPTGGKRVSGPGRTLRPRLVSFFSTPEPRSERDTLGRAQGSR